MSSTTIKAARLAHPVSMRGKELTWISNEGGTAISLVQIKNIDVLVAVLPSGETYHIPLTNVAYFILAVPEKEREDTRAESVTTPESVDPAGAAAPKVNPKARVYDKRVHKAE